MATPSTPCVKDCHAGASLNLFIFPGLIETSMRLLAFNGSPRKKWNTATLLKHALEGAESEGAKTKLYHLYDLDFTGCISCFACKRIGGKSYGHCAVKDDLAPIFAKIEKADAILIGSPIYLGITTGVTRCFLERLIYQYLVYDPERSSLFGKKIRTAFIYTAGATEEMVRERGFDRNVQGTEMVMERIFGSCESFFVTDTYQFNDYAKYVSTAFNPEEKKKRRDKQFPLDCKKAYELGARLVKKEK
jgi:multimeric flavodoxin WrbA